MGLFGTIAVLIHCWWIGPAERERERERERESGGRSNNVASDWQIDHATHSTRAATVENVIRGKENIEGKTGEVLRVEMF